MTMNFLGLPTGDFILILDGWLDPALGRRIIEANDKLSPFLPDLHLTRDNIVAAQPTEELDLSQAELGNLRQELSVQMKVLDQNGHDRGYRCSWYLFQAASYQVPHQRAIALLDCRTRLMPDGLSQTQKAWSVEAGEVERLEKELQRKETKQICDDLVLNGETMTSILNRVIAAGRQLGELYRQRETLAELPQQLLSLHQARLACVDQISFFVELIDRALPPHIDAHKEARRILLSVLYERLEALPPKKTEA